MEISNQEILEKVYDKVKEILPTIIILAIVGFVLFRINKILTKHVKSFAMKGTKKLNEIEKKEVEKRIDTLSDIFKGIMNIAVWAILIMVFLKKINIDIGPLLAGLGIVGVALGFGSQELVRDVISGMFILSENQIRTGDVGIINGTGGLVEKIGLRTIRLRDFSGTVHIFQNGKINTLSNMTKDWSAVVFEIGVAYKEDVDNVISVMEAVGKEIRSKVDFKEKIIEDLEIFGVERFDDSAVVIKARLKTKPIEQWTIGREYRKMLKKAFDEKNIEIPFPHTTLYWGEKIKPLNIELMNKEKN